SPTPAPLATNRAATAITSQRPLPNPGLRRRVWATSLRDSETANVAVSGSSEASEVAGPAPHGSPSGRPRSESSSSGRPTSAGSLSGSEGPDAPGSAGSASAGAGGGSGKSQAGYGSCGDSLS